MSSALTSPQFYHPLHSNHLSSVAPVNENADMVGASPGPLIDSLNEWGDDLVHLFLQPYGGVFDDGGILEGYEDPDDEDLYYL